MVIYPFCSSRSGYELRPSRKLASEQLIVRAGALKVGDTVIYAPDEKPVPGIGNMTLIASFPPA